MQGNRWQIELQQSHILDDQGIRTRFIQLMSQLLGHGQFIILQQGIEGDIDMGPEAVGKAAQLLDILHAISGCRPSTKGRPADIDRIGTVADRLNAGLQIFSRSQKLQRMSDARHGYLPAGNRKGRKIGAEYSSGPGYNL